MFAFLWHHSLWCATHTWHHYHQFIGLQCTKIRHKRTKNGNVTYHHLKARKWRARSAVITLESFPTFLNSLIFHSSSLILSINNIWTSKTEMPSVFIFAFFAFPLHLNMLEPCKQTCGQDRTCFVRPWVFVVKLFQGILQFKLQSKKWSIVAVNHCGRLQRGVAVALVIFFNPFYLVINLQGDFL